jgi:hypothetical protein
MKTRGWNGRVVFIVLSVLQIQENNEFRLVNSQVNSIVLKCLETLVEPKRLLSNFLITDSKFILIFRFSLNDNFDPSLNFPNI